MQIRDLTNRKFGKLTAIQINGRKSNGSVAWDCQCECGNICNISSSDLVNNKTKSCGCLRRGKIRQENPFWKGCGELSGHRFGIYRALAKRENIEFDITIEEAWQQFINQNQRCIYTNKLLTFYPEQTASLNRIDSSDHYHVNNIQWVHKSINTMKMDRSHEDFINTCRLITENYFAN